MGLKSDDVYTAQLQAILRIACDLREFAAGSLPPTQESTTANKSPPLIDSIDLPGPCPLLPSLFETGVGPEISSAVNKVYLQRAEEFKHHIQQSILTAWRELAELPVIAPALSLDSLMEKIVSTSTEIYVRRLAQWKEEIIQRVKQASKPLLRSKVTCKTVFNHEYVPVLEHFFEDNAFPTHADKMFLAKKSGMEYRQIHVWFQNRRNRSKKEGKTLKKISTYEGATKPLDKLYERLNYTGSHTPKPSKTSSSDLIVKCKPSDDAFASTSPLHAFPSSYPPTCNYDPFPCKSGPVYFSKPEWEHVPNGRPLLSPLTTIDDLVEKFSRLNVRDGTRSKGFPQSQSHAATAAITVIPSRAPHPSLIIGRYSPPTNIIRLVPSVRVPVSRPKAFRSPSPTSRPVTLIPLSTQPNTRPVPGKRKISPLPQRLPGRMQNASRDSTQSEGSSTSSSPRFFFTDTESRSCSLSSVSSHSSPEDISKSQELPSLFGSPYHSLLDSPNYLWSLGDT